MASYMRHAEITSFQCRHTLQRTPKALKMAIFHSSLMSHTLVKQMLLQLGEKANPHAMTGYQFVQNITLQELEIFSRGCQDVNEGGQRFWNIRILVLTEWCQQHDTSLFLPLLKKNWVLFLTLMSFTFWFWVQFTHEKNTHITRCDEQSGSINIGGGISDDNRGNCKQQNMMISYSSHKPTVEKWTFRLRVGVGTQEGSCVCMCVCCVLCVCVQGCQ